MKVRLRADHVGSLLRTPRLKAARKGRHEDGTKGAASLRRVEDEEIAGVVALQESLGLGASTDGEFRRSF